MRQNPFISFIIPVYNRSCLLAECITSILNAKYTDYEIILIDDASTDGSDKICEEYAIKYDFIHFSKFSKNYGVGKAKNKGLQLAKGEYVFFLDSDDIIDSQALPAITKTLKEYPQADLIWMNYYENFIGSSHKINYIKTEEAVDMEVFLSRPLNLVGWMWRFFFRRDFIKEKKISIPSVRCTEDQIFISQCLLYANIILLCPDCFCVYQRHKADNSITKMASIDIEKQGFFKYLQVIGEYCQKSSFHVSRKKAVEYMLLRHSFPSLLLTSYRYTYAECDNYDYSDLFSFYYKYGGVETLHVLRCNMLSILKNITQDNPLFLCPAGNASKSFASYAIVNGLNISGFLDNVKTGSISVTIKNEENHPMPIFPIEQLLKTSQNELYILINSAYIHELTKQIESLDLKKHVHIITIQDLILRLLNKFS